MTTTEGQPHHDAASMLDRITESVIAKLAIRVIFPLLVLVAIPLVVAQWNGMRADIALGNSKTAATGEKLVTLEREVTTINTKLDAGLIWRLTQLERRFEAMEARVERRDGSPPPP